MLDNIVVRYCGVVIKEIPLPLKGKIEITQEPAMPQGRELVRKERK